MIATGAQGEAIQKLHRMVASSSVFQTRVKTYGQGETQAGRFIYSPVLNDPDQTQRPFAVIRQGTVEWYTVSGGRKTGMLPKGTLKLILADNSQVPESFEDAEVDFRNFVDGVLEDLSDMSGVDDLLNIVTMRETETVALSHPATVAENFGAVRPYFNCEYEIDWDSI